MSYHPTIWRTCRALANPRRLRCLRAVLLSPGLAVGEVASAAKLPQDQASLCLRALQARGLLHASREGRWVRYYPLPDPLVPTAAPILVGVSRALLKERVADRALIRSLTAFTHPRRLCILRHLQRGGTATSGSLSRSGRMSEAALFRHLNKLAERGVVGETDRGWALRKKQGALEKVFLALLAGAEET